MSNDQKTMTGQAWAELILLGTIWGGSFVGNRLTVLEFDTLTTVGLRMASASLMMWAWVWWAGLRVPRDWQTWGAFLVAGLVGNAIPFSLILWGQHTVPAGLAAIILCSATIFSILFAAAAFSDERLNPRKLVGAATGVAGVVVAIGIGNLTQLNPGSMGQLACLGAAFAYGMSSNWARARLSHLPPQVATAGVLSMAALLTLPPALWINGLPGTDHSLQGWIALVYLSFVATGIAYLLMFRLIATAGAGNASLNTLISAPMAMLLGALILGETMPARAWPGFALIALGLLIIDGRILRHFWRAGRPLPR